MLNFKASSNEAGRRLDVFIHGQLSDLSRSLVQKIFENRKVMVNDKQGKPGYKLHQGDEVTVDYDKNEHQADSITLPIVYEDNDCVVINKPSGILTHSKGAFNPEATVALWLRSRLSGKWSGINDVQQNTRVGIVHRLDRATSGVMICAKTPEALSWLQKQFSLRKVKKTYLAVVTGVPDPIEAIIDMPIERSAKMPRTFRVSNSGKPAVTKYKVLETIGNYSLLELQPQTGRTHQLRVHLKQLGFPIVGDVIYGGPKAARLMLHAAELEITLPNRVRKVFTTPVPVEFKNFAQQT